MSVDQLDANPNCCFRRSRSATIMAPSGASPYHHRTRWVMVGVRAVMSAVTWSERLRRIAALMVSICASAGPAFTPDGAVAQEPDHRLQILMLYSSDSLLPSADHSKHGFRRRWKPAHSGRPTVLHRRSRRRPVPWARSSGKDARLPAREVCEHTHIDLVFALGPPRSGFCWRATVRRCLPDAPSCSLPASRGQASRLDKACLPNTTGIASRFDPVATLELGARAAARTRHVCGESRGRRPSTGNGSKLSRGKFKPLKIG